MMRKSAYFIFNFLLLLAFSYFAFSHNPGRLFIGNDGPMLLALAKEQLAFFGVSLNLHTNIQQGIGNLSFPMNLSAVPGHWFPIYDSNGNFRPAATYTWFAGLMFVTVLLVGWNYRFGRGITYAAAWLLTLLMFPYFENYFRIYAVTSSSPIFIIYMFAVAIADIGIQRLGKHYLYMLPLLAGIFIMLVVSPAAVILIAPFLGLSFSVSFFLSDSTIRKRMMLAGVIVLTLCILLGWVEYVAGLLLYSSSGFFFSELADSYANAREFASILFQGHLPDRAFGPYLFILASIGACWALYSKNQVLRKPALITLTGQGLHALIAAQLLAWSDGWAGPPPIYTEMTFFILYALFMIYVIAHLFTHRYAAYCLPVLAVGLMTALIFILPQMKERNLLYSFAMPPAKSAIIDILEKEIPAKLGVPFAGRVATVLPATINAQTLFSYKYNISTKNDHLSDGLWLHNIPTLTEYNQLITPAFYRVVRNFLTLPNDKQNRSWASFSYADQKILQMLGVRFLLSTDAARDNAIKRAQVSARNAKPLYLFELPDANTIGKSANKMVLVSSLSAAEDAMGNKAFDAESAVLFSPIAGEFVPATTSSITLEKGGYHIRAESTGRTLLMVPIEYSHCSEMMVQSGERPEIQRVNIALTGLVFEKKMDILLSTSIGPFHQPRCRMRDYYEFKKLV